MAGTSPAMTKKRHTKRVVQRNRVKMQPMKTGCRRNSSCPAMCRASTSWRRLHKKDVAGRDKPGHDEKATHVADAPQNLTQNAANEIGLSVKFVMPGLVPGIHVLAPFAQERRGWPGQARP